MLSKNIEVYRKVSKCYRKISKNIEKYQKVIEKYRKTSKNIEKLSKNVEKYRKISTSGLGGDLIGETSLLSPSQTPTNLQNAAVVFIHGSGILSQGVDLIRQGKCYDRSGETIM